MRPSWLCTGFALALAACGPREVVDGISQVCFTAPDALPGTLHAAVLQSGGEQRPEDGTCSLAEEGDGWRLTTSFFVDRDPTPFADALILSMGSADCSAEVDGADPVVVSFGTQALEVPADGGEHCFARSGVDTMAPIEAPLTF